MSAETLSIALIGNPNCGKTALFNRLTGSRAKVANYAGVTVERRSGRLSGANGIDVLDLPGTYSLHVTSPDEAVAREVVLGERAEVAAPDVLLAVVDAVNLRLGLRLVIDLLALGRPMVLAVNMVDEAQARGMQIDLDGLARDLGIPVFGTVATRADGAAALRERLLLAAREPLAPPADLLDGQSPDAVIAQLMDRHVRLPAHSHALQDRIDHIVLHPLWGSLILLFTMLLMFQAVFAWAAPLMDGIDAGIAALSAGVTQILPDGPLRALLVDGVLAGMGAVLVFLPQILILFGFILVLEDSGYLPRAALLLDRPMRMVGLSGRAFIPLLSSFACAVPGVMATRTMADPRERWATIMVAPLMTCSARLPVYAVVIGAFIPARTVWGLFNLQGLVLLALYLAGMVSAALIALLLRGWRKRDAHFPLLLELPRYRWPHTALVLAGLRERAGIFLRKVGGIILLLSIVIWALANYPAPPADYTGSAVGYSLAGRIGHLLQPLFAPLGFSWEMCVALIPAMAAREVAVATLATVYAVGDAGGDAALTSALGAHWSLPVALAYLAWFVYAPQCIATLAAVRRETNSRKVTAAFTVGLFVLAYGMAWLTYRLASAWLA